jgi:hypothetical protein
LVRRRRSWESDAGSGKRRLIFRPSPFAAARLPFAAPLPLLSPVLSPCFLRSLGLPAPSLPPALRVRRRLPFLCFHGSASLSPGLLFAGPGSHAAIPGENPVRPGFSAWHNPVLAMSDPRGPVGLAPGNPDRSRRWIPPGPGGLKAARRPHGRAVPLVVSLMVSLVVSLRVGSVEGDRARPGFSGRLRGKEPRQVPDPGDSLKTPSWSTRQGSTAFR